MKKALKVIGLIALIVLPFGFVILGVYKLFVEKRIYSLPKFKKQKNNL